jgi:hypothetical protein
MTPAKAARRLNWFGRADCEGVSPRLKCGWHQIKFRLQVFPLQLQQGRGQAALRDKILIHGVRRDLIFLHF